MTAAYGSLCEHGYVESVHPECFGAAEREELRKVRGRLREVMKESRELARDVDLLLDSVLEGAPQLSDFGQDVRKRVRRAAK